MKTNHRVILLPDLNKLLNKINVTWPNYLETFIKPAKIRIVSNLNNFFQISF